MRDSLQPRAGLVYTVSDVSDPERVRYVGRTIQDLPQRIRDHWAQLRYGRRAAFQHWLAKRNPEDVVFAVFSTHDNPYETDEAEKKAIAYFRLMGMADLNIKDGGQGGTGGPWTNERRERQMVTVPRGDSHCHSKLTERSVREIRELRAREWVSSTELAKKYGVSVSQISSVLRNKEWVDNSYNPSGIVKLSRKAENAYHRTLTWEKVRRIRENAQQEYVSTYKLASIYETSQPNIRDILANRIWVDELFNPQAVKKRPAGFKEEQKTATRVSLTEEDVVEMRNRFNSGETLKSLSLHYGIIPNSVSRIVNGKTWGHVKEGLKCI